jgi:hypothetical protein
MTTNLTSLRTPRRSNAHISQINLTTTFTAHIRTIMCSFRTHIPRAHDQWFINYHRNKIYKTLFIQWLYYLKILHKYHLIASCITFKVYYCNIYERMSNRSTQLTLLRVANLVGRWRCGGGEGEGHVVYPGYSFSSGWLCTKSPATTLVQ